MATRSDRLVPARAVHPGEILREELQERGICQKDFAQMIGIELSCLCAFINGEKPLDHELATMLDIHLGIPYKTWMDLHNGYICDCVAIDAKKRAADKSAPTIMANGETRQRRGRRFADHKTTSDWINSL